MTKFFLRHAVAALLCCASGALHADTVTIIPRWTIGETVRYVVVQHATQDGASAHADEPAQAFHEVLRVQKKLKDGYLIDWQRTVPGIHFEPRVQAELQFKLPAVMRLIGGVHLQLRVDQAANPVAIENARQAAAEIAAAFKQFEAQSGKYPQLAAWRRYFRELEALRSEALLSAFYLRQAGILMAPIGREYDSEKTRIEEESLPNPAGGTPFPARTSFRLSAYDQKQQSAGVDITTTIDAEQSAAAVKQLAQAIAPQAPALATPKIGINDEAHYEVNLRSGWPEQITWARNAEIRSGSGSVDSRQRDALSYQRIDQHARHVATVMPEIINFSPFTAVLTAAYDGPRPFLAMVMKVGFRRQPDGGWKVDDAPVELVSNPVAYLGCPVGPANLEDSISFKPGTEVYLRHDPSWPKQVQVRAGELTAGADNRAGCLRFAANQPRARFPYLQSGVPLSVSADEQIVRAFAIPAGFYPYTLVRYWSGEMLPAPARLDTLVFGADPDYVVATYRAGFGATAPIRKVEFRTVLPDAWLEDKPGDARQKALRQAAAMRAYLEACPVPSVPGGEACSAKNYPHDLRLLAPALGIGE